MDAFALALDALFNSDGARDATYMPQGAAAEARSIRVIHGRPDREMPYGEGRLIEGTNIFEIRRSDVDPPRKGDILVIGDDAFRLLGKAMIDVEGLSYTIGAEAAG